MEEENRDKRSSMFTVRNAENAMITFTIFALFYFLVVVFHEILIRSQSFVDALYSVCKEYLKDVVGGNNVDDI